MREHTAKEIYVHTNRQTENAKTSIHAYISIHTANGWQSGAADVHDRTRQDRTGQTGQDRTSKTGQDRTSKTGQDRTPKTGQDIYDGRLLGAL